MLKVYDMEVFTVGKVTLSATMNFCIIWGEKMYRNNWCRWIYNSQKILLVKYLICLEMLLLTEHDFFLVTL